MQELSAFDQSYIAFTRVSNFIKNGRDFEDPSNLLDVLDTLSPTLTHPSPFAWKSPDAAARYVNRNL